MVSVLFGYHTCNVCNTELHYAIDYQYKKYCIDCYTKELLDILEINTVSKDKVNDIIGNYIKEEPKGIRYGLPINPLKLLKELGIK